MEKTTIGYKYDLKIYQEVLLVIAGLIVMGIALYIFLFVIGGAIGGAILGGVGFLGASLIGVVIAVRRLPKDLIQIDEERLYLPAERIMLTDINSVRVAGKKVIITPKHGKEISQGFISNADECANLIKEQMTKKVSTNNDSTFFSSK